MARYIDGDALLREMHACHSTPLFIGHFSDEDVMFRRMCGIVQEQPTADVEEVRHGYWIDKPTGRYCHMGSWCSFCQEKSGIGGIESNRHKPYCPYCGAKMDGKE